MKYPPHLYTIVVSFGPNMPPFQQHHADSVKAGRILADLKSRMVRSQGMCIESLQMWHKGKMISSHIANPPAPVWLPPKDPDGVRRIPEHGRKPKRLPSTTPQPSIHPTGQPFKLVL